MSAEPIVSKPLVLGRYVKRCVKGEGVCVRRASHGSRGHGHIFIRVPLCHVIIICQVGSCQHRCGTAPCHLHPFKPNSY